MKAHAGGYVEIVVAVVHAMETPQQRHGVEQHVLQVDGKVQDDHRGEYLSPIRQSRQPVEHPPAPCFDGQGGAHGRTRVEQAEYCAVHRHQPQVGPPPLRHGRACPAPWRPTFGKGHGQEHGTKSTQANPWLVLQDVPHGASRYVSLRAPRPRMNPDAITASKR